MMTRFLRPLAALALVALLPACAAISALGDAAEPPDVYDLRPAQLGFAASGATGRDLVIEEPNARGALDTDRILIRPNPLQAQYLPNARWSDSTPAMVQTQLLRAFEDAGALRYVGRRPLGLSGDFALISELTDFQAELQPDGRSAMVRIRLSARLVREDDASIRGARVFEATAAAASTQTLDLVAAFDAAAGQLVPELTAWALQAMGVGLRQAVP
ncbi:ABC-type transport auxiliary lipoprotein family protein [Plastorhodobacter daqingensis]|uniref:ABC-type transport auxiliary lipoprotein family protein n=1 Tax=Plastorhodobacter daqingensis TaxID=1387281 RepID=A0ABW2UEV2_9RHOB